MRRDALLHDPDHRAVAVLALDRRVADVAGLRAVDGGVRVAVEMHLHLRELRVRLEAEEPFRMILDPFVHGPGHGVVARLALEGVAASLLAGLGADWRHA